MKQNHDKLLITFGCSWTAGVGCNYKSGMSKFQYMQNAWNTSLNDVLSFRGLLSRDLGFDNLNFSEPGSSNQSQFRSAQNFFCSPLFSRYRQNYKKIIVLWGITSVLRGEFYSVVQKKWTTIFYTVPDNFLSKCILADHFDLTREISLVMGKIRFWNDWFDQNQIKNLWFDTFNHHDYTSVAYYENAFPELIEDYKKNAGPDWPVWGPDFFKDFDKCESKIQKEILDCIKWPYYVFFPPELTQLIGFNSYPRDLLSQLCILKGFNIDDKQYHASDWHIDCDRIQLLLDAGLLNPISKHPTPEAHGLIADLIKPCLENSHQMNMQ